MSWGPKWVFNFVWSIFLHIKAQWSTDPPHSVSFFLETPWNSVSSLVQTLIFSLPSSCFWWMKWFLIGCVSIIFSTGCLSMTKGTLLCKHRVSQYLKYNECIVHCQLVLWWSFCLEIQSIWSSIFDVWWFNPEELQKMDRAWNSQTEAFIDYL